MKYGGSMRKWFIFIKLKVGDLFPEYIGKGKIKKPGCFPFTRVSTPKKKVILILLSVPGRRWTWSTDEKKNRTEREEKKKREEERIGISVWVISVGREANGCSSPKYLVPLEAYTGAGKGRGFGNLQPLFPSSSVKYLHYFFTLLDNRSNLDFKKDCLYKIMYTKFITFLLRDEVANWISSLI